MKSPFSKSVVFGLALSTCAWWVSPSVAQEISPASSTRVEFDLPSEPATPGPASTGLNADQVRAIVRDELQRNPKLLVEAINAYMAEEQKKKEASALEQTLAVKDLVTASMDYPFTGNANGAVEVYYYFDSNCSYCKKLEPQLTKFVKDNPDVKLVHREMPILYTSGSNTSSSYAAQVGGVFFAKFPGKYEALHIALMKNKVGMSNSDIDRAVIDLLGPAEGAKLIQDAVDVDGNQTAKAVSDRISATLDTVRKAGITGTPFVFVKRGDGIMNGLDADAYGALTRMANKSRALAN